KRRSLSVSASRRQNRLELAIRDDVAVVMLIRMANPEQVVLDRRVVERLARGAQSGRVQGCCTQRDSFQEFSSIHPVKVPETVSRVFWIADSAFPVQIADWVVRRFKRTM
ncbi:MAG: hypothetical protein ABI478_14785, partial [Propionivibrio sp.]